MSSIFNKPAFDFTEKLTDLDIRSKRGSGTTVTIPQVRWDGASLEGEVGHQSFILDSNGRNQLKLRSAYHKVTPLCSFVPNDLSGDTGFDDFPLKRKKIEDFDDIEAIPKEIKDTEKNGSIIDYLYEEYDEKGNELLAKAVKDEKSGRWVLRKYNVPIYKSYMDSKGRTLSKGDGEDEKGFYNLTFGKYTYFSNFSVGLFNGHAVDENKKMIADSEGTYMTFAPLGADEFFIPTAQKSGAKFTIGSILGKVLTHSMYGVATSDDLTKNGYLKKGRMKFRGTPSTLAVYNGSGEVAAYLVGRPAFKIEDFRAKGTKKTAEIDNNVEEKASKNEAVKAVSEEAYVL